MAKKPVQTTFNFPLDVLIQTAKRTCSFMERDAAEFITYNVTAEVVDSFQTKIRQLEDIPKDIELAGLQADATRIKDAANTALKNAIRSIMARAENKFGADSAKYRRFGTKGLSKMNDTQLLKCADTVKRVALDYLTELTSEGLTEAMLTALETLRMELDVAVQAQEDTLSNRDIATQDRTLLANSVYADLVKFCNSGKTMWAASNEARYNDYIIYNTVSGTPEPAEMV